MSLLSLLGGEAEEPERGLHCCCNNFLGNILGKECVQTWPEEMHCLVLYCSMLLVITWKDKSGGMLLL
jgi:hypothetical protein